MSNPRAANIVGPLQTIGIVQTNAAAQGQTVVIHDRQLGTFAERPRDTGQLPITVAEHPPDDFTRHMHG